MPKKPTPIRTAETPRGQNTMMRILDTAQALLKEQWLGEISISALAKKADVKRSSLLLQFPNGWPDIACILTDQLLFHPFDQRVIAILDRPRSRSRSIVKNAIDALETFIDQGEKSGRLVANLRSQMFVWGNENDEIFHCPAQDYNEEFAELLAGNGQTVTDKHRSISEALINFSLDVAGGAGLYPYTQKERRELLTAHVEVTLGGLDSMTVDIADFTIRTIGSFSFRETSISYKAASIVQGMEGLPMQDIVAALKSMDESLSPGSTPNPKRWITHFAGLESKASGKAMEPWIEIIHDGQPIHDKKVFAKLLSSAH